MKKNLVLVFFLIGATVVNAQHKIDIFKDTVFVKLAQIKSITQPKRGVENKQKKLKIPQNRLANTKIRTVFPIPTYWDKKNIFGFTLNEVAFVNWNAGGNNSVSGLVNIQLARNYKTKKTQWNNEVILKYGLNAQENRKLRKTDDEIRLNITFGYRKDTLSYWFLSSKVNFKTQFYNGYKYPDRDTPISAFMAPGYLFTGLGLEYSPIADEFKLYISPITQKTTFVLNEELADQGAFGVEKAVLDVDGNVIRHGKTSLTEFGFLINSTWEKEVLKNIKMQNRINLYTDYLNSFGNIDIDWELNFDFLFNKFIKANIGTHLIFDDDVRFNEVKNENGEVIFSTTKIQFKQLFGFGLLYTF